MIRIDPRWLAACCALLLCGCVAADVYRWIDDQGEVHYGQVVPPEYKDKGYDRLDDNGQLIDRVERALTAEERRERERLREEQTRLETERRDQAQKDRRLLSSYRSEQDLVEDRDSQLAMLARRMESLDDSRVRLGQRFESLVRRAAQLNRNDETVPAQLTSEIEQAREKIRELRRAIDEIEEQKASLTRKFEEQLERFRELMDQQAE